MRRGTFDKLTLGDLETRSGHEKSNLRLLLNLIQLVFYLEVLVKPMILKMEIIQLMASSLLQSKHLKVRMELDLNFLMGLLMGLLEPLQLV